MKVVHVSSMDQNGGANLAAFRLVQAQVEANIDACLCVQEKFGDCSFVIPGASIMGIPIGRVRRFLEKRLTRIFCKGAHEPYSACLLPGNGVDSNFLRTADVLHLHHIGQGALSLDFLSRTRIPMVWTLHDMWPLLGGEHYRGDDDLDNFTGNSSDIDKRLWRRKAALYERILPVFVSPSEWLAECARRAKSSSRVPVEVIPNPTGEAFYPEPDRVRVRRELGLPEKAPILLFGADHAGMKDPRKGLDLLIASMKDGALSLAGTQLLVIGNLDSNITEQFPLPVHCLGQIRSPDTLRFIYNAADAFVIPSRQDNLPNMVVESLACGTPVCGFRIGGIPDLVKEGVRGSLAIPYNVNMLRKSIETALAMGKEEGIRTGCSRFVKEHLNSDQIVERYGKIYKKLLERGTTGKR